MNYLDTAFGQLAFAWKLYNYGLDKKIDLAALDVPIQFREGNMVLTLAGKVLDSERDLIIALQNNLSIAFGAAAITLNRCREEANVHLSDPIATEIDQFAAVVYQIRNAFAHDISEPRWEIRRSRFIRAYEFGGLKIDLSNLRNKPFEYSDIGGPEILFRLKEFGSSRVWG